MVSIPLVGADFKRLAGKIPTILMKNRYAEKNPVFQEEPVAVLARPGMSKFAEVGAGPIRKVYNCPGAFNGDLFVVSGQVLYRVSSIDLSVTSIGTISTSTVGDVSMCATAPIGTVPAYLFIAEGGVLWCYCETGHATATLTASGTIANGDIVQIDTTYYKFVNTTPGAGAGTSGSPWQVAMGITNATALTNLYKAIGATGTSGTTYTTGLTKHTTVQAIGVGATQLSVEAITVGVTGNTIAVSKTATGLTWSGTTLANGGSAQLRQVLVPGSLGAISVAVINSFVIVIPTQGTSNKGQFYWINPGDNIVQDLNFATAERNPDGVYQVVVYGDMFWLLGENTTEPWITTGIAATPMQRYKGVLYDRGAWQGTAVQVKDSLIVVDQDGAVFENAGGQKRISRPDIEEQIRRAKQIQKGFGL